ncbi:(2Fe-2S) ferredoxin domain-containing protein [Pleurocapsales cyanobacterium LEGE 06147]|nr:(2Fe-2S) ferredoxin domain-containing protein [Pleurocapsales cyanobacterium LEGE 06147]
MAKTKNIVSEFNFVGQLIDVVTKNDNQIKYLKLSAANKEYWIKVAKEIREDIRQIVTPGCKLQVRGKQKRNIKNIKVKYKAYAVELVNEEQGKEVNSQPLTVLDSRCPMSDVLLPTASQNSLKPAAKILVCKKSSCWKRGGEKVCQVIEAMRRDRDLGDKIQIKTTGCLKRCKQGPNLVIMPDKARYSNVKPQQVPLLLEKHLFSSLN